jgi:hypothetical protein
VDSGSGIEQIRIRDPGWKKVGSGIRDKRIRNTGAREKSFLSKKKLEPESGGKADIWPVPLVGNDVGDVGEHGL